MRMNRLGQNSGITADFWCKAIVLLLALACHAMALAPAVSMNDPVIEQDDPTIGIDSAGTRWLAWVEWDGNNDMIRIGRVVDGQVEVTDTLDSSGILYRPSLAAHPDRKEVWTVWSRLEGAYWRLMGRQEAGEGGTGLTVLAEGEASHVDVDAALGSDGTVWVTWQSIDAQRSVILVMRRDAVSGKWSEPVEVGGGTRGKGAWRPRIVADEAGHAWVAFDQAGEKNFDVKLARVKADGDVDVIDIAATPRYEAAAELALSPDGKTVAVAFESAGAGWGLDTRGGGQGVRMIAMNIAKQAHVVTVDTETLNARELPGLKRQVIRHIGGLPRTQALALNLPQAFYDGAGRLWASARFAMAPRDEKYWRVVLFQYDPKSERWSEAVKLEQSAMTQDRRIDSAVDADGRVWMTWPADGRTSPEPGPTGIYAAPLDSETRAIFSDEPLPPLPKDEDIPALESATFDAPNENDRATFTHNGKTYTLYYGDLHRHTSFSADGTINDGCIVEQFRYARELGALDFLGTSDHTDIGKAYTPYEWWQTQKLADLYHVPGRFMGMYAYEREQRFPWGHRNVVFAERGGPIVYVQRKLYQDSPWGKLFPVPDGDAQILPHELWPLLRTAGIPVSVISHTGGDPGMGTDWGAYARYGSIDPTVENVVEIYQGHRLNYESLDAPQPTVGIYNDASKQRLDDLFRNRLDPRGTYRNALQQGHKLGVFASSDHFSTHVSFGGVFAEELSRHGIVEGLNARRTIAATDRIQLIFLCNDRPMGSMFRLSEEAPRLSIHVKGTAPIYRVTIVRNELAYRTFAPPMTENKARFDLDFTDEKPLEGQNRYYIRVEQTDGNMAWSSPVWVETR